MPYPSCHLCGRESKDTRQVNSLILCYGCYLKWKDVGISGETVAGHTFGTPYYKMLTDTAQDQGVAAGTEWSRISKEMQAGGYVAQDRLQQACEIQRKRSIEAAKAVGAKGTISEPFNGVSNG